MPITDSEWQSISTLVNQVVRDTAGTKGDYFFTGKVFKVDKKNKCIYMKEFGSQAIPIVAFNYEVKYYDQTPENTAVQFDVIIGPNAAGPLPLSGGVTSDGRRQWLFVAGSGYSSTGGGIGLNVNLGGIDLGNSQVYTNEVSSHKTFIPLVREFTLPAGVRTLTLTAWSGTLCTNSDFFTAAVISSPVFKTRTKIVPATLVMPKKGDTVLIVKEMGTSRLPRCLGIVMGTKWISKGDE